VVGCLVGREIAALSADDRADLELVVELLAAG
jgi:hypothetical protein